MKPIRAFLLLCLLSGGTLLLSQDSPFALTISTPSHTIKAGEDIPLYVTYKNVSGEDAFLLSDLHDLFPPSAPGAMPPSRWTDGDEAAQEAYVASESRKRALNAPQAAEKTTKIVVLHADGTAVAKTAYGQDLEKPATDSLHCRLPCDSSVRVRPGSQRTDSTLLNRIYDLSTSGTYLIQVEYTGQRPNSATTSESASKSNTIRLIVLE